MKTTYYLVQIERQKAGYNNNGYYRQELVFKNDELLKKGKFTCAPYFLNDLKIGDVLPFLLYDKPQWTLKIIGIPKRYWVQKRRWK